MSCENKNKNYFNGLIWMLIIFLLLVIIMSICSVKFDGEYFNLFTILNGTISALSTLIIGIISIWLTHKIDNATKLADAKRDEELKQQNLLDLKFKANPIVYFDRITGVSSSTNSIIISNNESVNRLTDVKLDSDFPTYHSSLSLECVFKTNPQSIIENIKFNSVRCTIKDLNKIKYEKIFYNYSNDNSANLKLGSVGEVVAHIDLLTNEEFPQIEEKQEISLFCCFQSSNSFNISKSYDAEFAFQINEIVETDNWDKNYNIQMVRSVMWAEKTINLQEKDGVDN